MPYFFSNENLFLGGSHQIDGEEARHILLSHRVKICEKLKLQGPDGKRFLSEVVSAGKKDLMVKALEQLEVPEEPKIKITLFQSVVSEKALDFIFQKGTELGLSSIVLFNSANTATKFTRDIFAKKEERWNKILEESAKQCERSVWPSLQFAFDMNQVLETVKSLDEVFLTDISGQRLKTTNNKLQTAGLIIGPEGGFTKEEVSEFKKIPNVEPVSLGPILLRAETAALATTAIILN